MFEGYLELGGNEIVNSARSAGYLASGDCPTNWIVCPPCPGVLDAIGGLPYTLDNIADAPWYDAEEEASHRFLGVHALSVDGLMDSTRTASISEGITDGGVVGQVRHSVRQTRVRALLSALGQDALESGLAWLKAALDPEYCGIHGSSCGATDSCFFTACPPARSEVTSPGPIWNGPLTNLAKNPSFETAVGGVVSNVSPPPADQAVGTQTTDSPSRGTHALRYTLGVAPAVGLAVLDFLPPSGVVYTLIGKVRPRTRDHTIAPRIRAAVGPTFSAPKDVWTPFRLTIAAGTGGVQQTGLLLSSTSGHQPGDIIDIDEVLLIEGSYEGDYFDGSFPSSSEEDMAVLGQEVVEYAWVATANGSESTFRTGRVSEVPDPGRYEDAVDVLQRTMHDVTCISGPLIEQKLHRNDMWGYIVEFTLAAGTPWLFGITRDVVIPPGQTPIVVQDVPFNLVPYPSAELSSGTVVVSTNYAPNPSVEVDATGWSAGGDGTIILTSTLAGARSTELSAHGAASYKVTFTATTTATNGYFRAQHVVPLPGITATTRYSVNLWASASVQSGTAVMGNLEYRAQWQDSGGTLLRDDLIFAGSAAGGAQSAKSILPPTGTAQVTVRALLRMTSWSTGAVVRLYADAAAVTLP